MTNQRKTGPLGPQRPDGPAGPQGPERANLAFADMLDRGQAYFSCLDFDGDDMRQDDLCLTRLGTTEQALAADLSAVRAELAQVRLRITQRVGACLLTTRFLTEDPRASRAQVQAITALAAEPLRLLHEDHRLTLEDIRSLAAARRRRP